MTPSKIRSPFDPVNRLPGFETIADTNIRAAAPTAVLKHGRRISPKLSPAVAHPILKGRATPKRGGRDER